MYKKFNSTRFNEILEIERKGIFNEGFALPGYHEVIDTLNDFERAVYTLAINVFNSDMNAIEKKFQLNTISGLLWFSIIDRLNLWEKPKYYGINKGRTIVIVDKESIKMMRPEAKTITSIDDLPEGLKNALTNLVMSSTSNEAGKGPISNN